jgi:hypothetical protein
VLFPPEVGEKRAKGNKMSKASIFFYSRFIYQYGARYTYLKSCMGFIIFGWISSFSSALRAFEQSAGRAYGYHVCQTGNNSRYKKRFCRMAF